MTCSTRSWPGGSTRPARPPSCSRATRRPTRASLNPVSDSRAYGLRADEPLPEGVARVARGRIDHAIDELSGTSKSSPEEAVHNARKDIKKLRALLRLIRGELG